MARETVPERKARALKVLQRLDAAMPDAHIELDYGTPLQLVTAVILSAQCTDKRVNMITPALFARYPDARALADADTHELEQMIRSCGFFRSKAKSLKGMAGAVAERYGGQVPTRRAELAVMPGVGPKTAGVVTVNLGGEPAFPVDTHVKRLSRRLGFTRKEDPSHIEADLQALVPTAWWGKGHQLLVWHGRRTCFARSPACDRCVVRELCPRIGVPKAKETAETAARPPPRAAVVPPRPRRPRSTRSRPGRRVAGR
ncbi:MAG TPA: endonuclease III [Myxococcaceae bacterium]|nr:endonuclease III [Myxococcaceae bacterium]